MNKRQRHIIINFITVIAITFLAIIVLINFKDWVNYSEAMRAMEDLSDRINTYRQRSGGVPPESYVERIKEKLKGAPRFGNLKYRARWIDIDSTDDEILAYSERDYHSFFVRSGYIVLRLGGTIEYMEKAEFRKLLDTQQSQLEKEMTID